MLLGTCCNSSWRTNLITIVTSRGVPRDRIVDSDVGSGNWNQGVKYVEDQVKAVVTHHIYYLDDPKEERSSSSNISFYSNSEVLTTLFDHPDRLAVAFDFKGLSGHNLMAIEAIKHDIETYFPKAEVLNGYGAVV